MKMKACIILNETGDIHDPLGQPTVFGTDGLDNLCESGAQYWPFPWSAFWIKNDNPILFLFPNDIFENFWKIWKISWNKNDPPGPVLSIVAWLCVVYGRTDRYQVWKYWNIYLVFGSGLMGQIAQYEKSFWVFPQIFKIFGLPTRGTLSVKWLFCLHEISWEHNFACQISTCLIPTTGTSGGKTSPAGQYK